MNASILEKKLQEKRVHELRKHLRHVYADLAKKLDVLNDAYHFANEENHKDVLAMLNTAFCYNVHENYFQAAYENEIKVFDSVKNSLVEKAIEDLLEGMEGHE